MPIFQVLLNTFQPDLCFANRSDGPAVSDNIGGAIRNLLQIRRKLIQSRSVLLKCQPRAGIAIKDGILNMLCSNAYSYRRRIRSMNSCQKKFIHLIGSAWNNNYEPAS